VNPDLAHIWTEIQAELRRAVPEATYDIWLAPLEPLALDDGTLVLAAPAALRTWVTERFARVLEACAAVVVGPAIRVDVVPAGEAARSATTGAGHRTLAPAGETERLNPKFTFDQYVIGDSNRLAHAAALAVAELPAQAYNPLFIYGPPGVGKTHLLHSIGNYVLAYGGGLTVRYTTVESFTNQFIAALQSGGVDGFKGRYRHNDVLLIDDVQFLASKAKTEEEFFHTFNALYDSGSQLVLTSDRLPRDLDALEDRLRERFEAGLVTDIRPPDLAMRMTVLRKRVQHDGIAIQDDAVLHAIAEHIPTNIRALEGALIRVVAYASLTARPLTGALAQEVLAGLYPAPRGARPTITEIQTMTCEAFGITRDELLSASRAGRLAWPRHVAMYLAREYTDATLPAIGASFGGRNHTTVMHACRRTAQRLAADLDAYETVRGLTERLTSSGVDRGS
jgi:chromosomal replication initiator protein